MSRKISVIMSVYSESPSWVELSINSILEQTYQDFEFIIVVDNPENNVAKTIIERFADKDNRVILLLNETNIGLTKSLNRGLSVSTGEYIARMDADDISHNDRFQKQVDFLTNNPEISVCSTDARVIDEESQIIASTRVHGRLNLEDLYHCSPLIHPSVMFRRSLLELRRPLYNEEYRVSQDYELWSFLYLNHAKFGIIPEALLDYRVSRKQISSKHQNEQEKNSFQIGHSFYLEVLSRMIPDVKRMGLEEQLALLSSKMGLIGKDETQMYRELLFRLYYTVSRTKKHYVFKYFIDPNLLVFKFPLRKSTYMLLGLFFSKRYDDMFRLYS